MSEHKVVITAHNFDQEVLRSDKPILVDFWAEWCGPCKALEPIVDQIAREYAQVLKVGKLNVDDYPELAMRYGVMGIPTLILFKEGREVARIVGYQPRERLLRQILPHLQPQPQR
ncbi:thioredoxin [Thermoflexus sp.]|uniref:thioredoxin n=1 Tax=Thermoflexus sp. TaxID=1969742 RepID=UPI0025D590F6|nr:thioredoxin [Thermoflexus sp.]MDW8065801.1 thioredoxin [Anaerolineae bacterium]MCS6964734.1 thioredoxin [Thermoflexus sp.]MCS7351788.1 thioredoxin [Thermoflexus sp.]MCX7690779.1 thioredoxin [Thermoflexus sp.]MDW8181247.1 thioredoxin [Anaerolineae bacterium]